MPWGYLVGTNRVSPEGKDQHHQDIAPGNECIDKLH